MFDKFLSINSFLLIFYCGSTSPLSLLNFMLPLEDALPTSNSSYLLQGEIMSLDFFSVSSLSTDLTGVIILDVGLSTSVLSFSGCSSPNSKFDFGSGLRNY